MDNLFEQIEDVKKSVDENNRQLEKIQKSVDEIKNHQVSNLPGREKSQQEILSDFIRSSRKEYVHLSTDTDFSKSKKFTRFVLLCYIGISVSVTILTSIGLKIYSTFTLFENIWLVLSCFMAHYTSVAQKFYETAAYAEKSIDLFKVTKENVWVDTYRKKKKYRVFFVLCLICAGLNIVVSFTFPNAITGLVIVFELIYIAATIFSYITYTKFFSSYGPLKFTGYNLSKSKIVTIYYDNIFEKYLTEEEFFKTYPWMKK